jgi:hypothetical protein
MSMKKGSNVSFFGVLLLMALCTIFGIYLGKAFAAKHGATCPPEPSVSQSSHIISLPFMF